MRKILTLITLLVLVASGSAMANSSNFQRMHGSNNYNGHGMNYQRMADNSDYRQKMGRGNFQTDSRSNDNVSNNQSITDSQYKQRSNMVQKQNSYCHSGRNN